MKTFHAIPCEIKCIFVACVSIFLYTVQADRPACDIPPADILERTTLTCYFPESFVQSKSAFRVVHLSRNVSVVDSIWEDGLPSFSLKEGFSMDGQKSKDRATFKINQVSLNDTGAYACIPEGYKPEDVGTCTLHLKTEPPKFEALVNIDSQDCSWPTYLYAVLFTAVIGVPVIALVIVLVLFVWIKTQRRQRDENGNANSPLKPDEENPLVIQQSENIAGRKDGCYLAIFAKLLHPFSPRPAEKVGLPVNGK